MWYSLGLAAGLGLAAALSPLPVAHDAPRNVTIIHKTRPAFTPPPCTNIFECRWA